MRKNVWLLFAAAVSLAAACADELDSGDDIVRRAAFRRMLENDRPEALRRGLDSRDPVIVRRAVLESFLDRGEQALPVLKRAAKHPDRSVRQVVLDCLRKLPDSPEKKAAVAVLREHSPDLVFPFTFHRIKPRLSERADWDHDVKRIASAELPCSGWKFLTDPSGSGHEKNFFAPKFDDSKWLTVGVGSWESQGAPDYDGIAWYRIAFDAPAKPACNAAELNFAAVDEEAWVWLNGIYVGQHAIGKAGWNQPFQLDVTEEIRWGERNILVVRVNDSQQAGGVWKPIRLDILR